MIVYKLRCDNKHEFEGWFKNISSFEEQSKGKMIMCPNCGSIDVVKVMASTRSLKRLKSDAKGDENVRMKVGLLKKISDTVKKEFENVGSRFPDEARKIYYGEAPPRNIYGTTTEKEEKELKDEGVEFFKFPMIKDYDD